MYSVDSERTKIISDVVKKKKLENVLVFFKAWIARARFLHRFPEPVPIIKTVRYWQKSFFVSGGANIYFCNLEIAVVRLGVAQYIVGTTEHTKRARKHAFALLRDYGCVTDMEVFLMCSKLDSSGTSCVCLKCHLSRSVARRRATPPLHSVPRHELVYAVRSGRLVSPRHETKGSHSQGPQATQVSTALPPCLTHYSIPCPLF